MVFGTVSYEWEPGKAVVTDFGGGSREGFFVLMAESIRLVDISSGEILISAYCRRLKGSSISKEISLAIKNKIFPLDKNEIFNNKDANKN